MIENIKELFSLEPNYFDRSFETLKKKPDALKELTSIQECLNDKYREATFRFEEIKQNGKSEEENEKALLEIEKEIKGSSYRFRSFYLPIGQFSGTILGS